MRVLGRQQLSQISSRVGYQGDLRTLASHLDDDDDLGVEAASNRLVFQCAGLIANASAAEIAAMQAVIEQATAAAVGRRQPPQTPAAAPQAFPPTLVGGTPDPTGLSAADAFSLHSRPGARLKLVLDFDGNTLVGGVWNQAKGLQQIVTPAYDKDGNPSSFNAEEIADIVAIWHAVAEDYAAFDVDVTTADPGDAALAGVGQKVLIGGHSGDWYGNAGGVAYVSSFGTPGMPCFVFPRNLGPNYAKYVWEAVSHELGHTLGLFHDGLTPNPAPGALYPDGTYYYSGHGNWAPIMGVGYYKDVTQFDAGEYPYSNNPQDDMGIIGRTLPRLPQQYGPSMASATPLSSSGAGSTTAVINGILSMPNQPDWFSLSAEAGSATLAVAVTAPFGQVTRANLNAVAAVYDAGGAVVTTLSPGTLDIPYSPVNLPRAGTYYVSVVGAAEGSPATGGYSSYGSLGFYSLTVSYTASSAPQQPQTPVNCVGYWSSFGPCDASCNQVSTMVWCGSRRVRVVLV
uniref:Peptidase C-terminal archaeal/bacterial domain-containing protein n=1 Tax=Tetradesmus obliquus TaxID=3088 RepID=A0A383WDE7_TETOB|eukprot:jgi/Sobl393_1/1859/SZX75273.1